MGRLLGITVLCDYILSEGPDAVLRRLHGARATAVALNPTVTAPACAETGAWQPPDDAGSSPRRFDRPLWGRRALYVRGAPAFAPDPALYGRTGYSPREANELTAEFGPVISSFVEKARSDGFKVFLQIGAVQPPGLREEDTPRLPSGALPAGRMAPTACLASSAIRRYNRAYAADLLRNYPQIDGIRLDWPEYPCYTLGEALCDWSPAALDWADARGLPLREHAPAARRLEDALLRGGLRNEELAPLALAPSTGAAWEALVRRLSWFPDLLRLKATLSADLLADWRSALDAAGGAAVELSANAFPPPWNRLTGFDFESAPAHCGSVSVKLYTMHWLQMVRFWGDTIMRANPDVDECLLLRAIQRLFDMIPADGTMQVSLDQFRYPEPEEPHAIDSELQRERLRQAAATAGPGAALYALVHGYGPPDDFRRRFRLAWTTAPDGVWVNRYGYLSDEKLEAIREETAG